MVNLASTAGLVGSTQDPLYSMGGVTLFTRSNLPARDTASGSTQCIPAQSTPIWATRCWSRGRAISAPTTSRRRVAKSSSVCPIGRMGTPDDIAKGIVFLASDDAAFMTGAGLVIDGGIVAQ
ncbi:MAG: SDR family oxidoreductase [Stellaceae bacterium]